MPNQGYIFSKILYFLSGKMWPREKNSDLEPDSFRSVDPDPNAIPDLEV